MYDPASRLLTILHLLHSHDALSAEALAAKLEVSTRTVRRYITLLRDLGIPIEAHPGAQGGYSLLVGRRLPPSIFNLSELQILWYALAEANLAHVNPRDVRALNIKIRLLLDERA